MEESSEGTQTDECIAEEIITDSSAGEINMSRVQDRVFFGRRRRSKRLARRWTGRLTARSGAYLGFFQGMRCGPTVFSALELHDWDSPSPLDGSCQFPHARRDLSGRLPNSEHPSSTSHDVGVRLEWTECFAWERSCPLQRVVVIAMAVAAAATFVAREMSAKEIKQLRRVIHERENALLLMREELGNLMSQVDILDSRVTEEKKGKEEEACPSVDELLHLFSEIDAQQGFASDLEKRDFPDNGRESEFLSSRYDVTVDTVISPVVNRQLCFSDLTKKISPIREESPSARDGPEQELMEKMMMSHDWLEALEVDLLEFQSKDEYQFDEAVNKDIVSEQSCFEADLERKSIVMPHDESPFGIGVPESKSIPAADIQDKTSAVEWLSETSSVILDSFSPMPSEKSQGNDLQSEEGSKDWWHKTLAGEKSISDRAHCASIILDIKKQVITILDEAASHVLETLTSIVGKVGQLEAMETITVTPRKAEEAWDKKSQAIKNNVSKASERITKLQAAMVHVWNSLGPKAMGSLDIFPSDFEDFLADLQIAKILNEDDIELSTGRASIQAWQDWFKRGSDNRDSSLLKKIQVSEETGSKIRDKVNVLDDSEVLAEWPPSGSIHMGPRIEMQEVSPVFTPFRQKVEKMLLPLLESKPETVSSPSQSKASLERVAEDLTAEFGKTAAKIVTLKKYVKACDLKRKRVEKKLLEAWEQDSKNQVKSRSEIALLKRQVRLKAAAYQQLIFSRKALVSSKSKEVAELREVCRQQSTALQDMESAAKVTQESSDKKLAMLEEICRKKDGVILSLKDDIFELESKVQELQGCQTPAQFRPMNLPSAEKDTDADSVDEVYDKETLYRTFSDECQLRGSYQSSENRRTSWGSDLSAQEFHIIDTPWSSELSAGQNFNVIEEAAFQGQSLSIFENVSSSQELLRNSLRRIGTTGGGGEDPNQRPSRIALADPDSRPTINVHREIRRKNIVPSARHELSKSVASMNMVTSRSKVRGDRLRASTGVLSSVGFNTPLSPRKSTFANKHVSESSLPNSSSRSNRSKENSIKSREKWV